MRPDRSAVDHLDLPVVGGAYRVHQAIPDARFPPANETVVAGRARTVALGQIAPWRTRAQDPKDAVQHSAVVNPRNASRLVRQQRLDNAPLEIGQIVSAHSEGESENPR